VQIKQSSELEAAEEMTFESLGMGTLAFGLSTSQK